MLIFNNFNVCKINIFLKNLRLLKNNKYKHLNGYHPIYHNKVWFFKF